MLQSLDKGIKGVRIGYDPEYSETNVDEELLTNIHSSIDLLKELGATIVEVSFPKNFDLRDQWRIICTYEAALAHRDNYPSRASEYGDFFGDFLKIGSEIDARSYEAASVERQKFNKQFETTLDSIDALLCPGGGVPFKVPSDLMYGSMAKIRSFMNPYTYFQFTIPANFAGVPALSLPCGVSQAGFLHSMQLMGSKLSEPLLCQIGNAYQLATEWHQYGPEV